MAPSQPKNPNALAQAHKEALELHSLVCRILAATTFLHTEKHHPSRRRIALGLSNNIGGAQASLLHLSTAADELDIL